MPGPNPTPSTAYSGPQPLEVSRILKLNSEMVYSDLFYKALSFSLLALLVTVPYIYSEELTNLAHYYIPHDPAKPVLIAFAVNLVTYTLGNLIFCLVYKLESNFFEQYKCNKTAWPWKTNYRRWRKLLRRTFKILAINFFVVSPPFMYLVSEVIPIGSSTAIADLPSFPVFLLQIFFMMVCEDFFFYCTHRLIHTPYLYKKIHYMHHEYKQNVAICSIFAHPVEYVLGDVVPTMAGAFIMGSSCHILTFGVFVMLRIIETQESHCGYEFPWAVTRFLPFNITTDYHDYHHHTNKGNYATFFIFWDTMFATNRWYYNQLDQAKKADATKAE